MVKHGKTGTNVGDSQEPSTHRANLLSSRHYVAVLLILAAALVGLIYASQTLVPPDRSQTYSGSIFICVLGIVVFTVMWFRQENDHCEVTEDSDRKAKASIDWSDTLSE